MAKKRKYNYYVINNTHKWMHLDEKLLTSNFNKIFKFFVVFSLCKRYATQGRNLESYGWQTNDTKSKNCLNNKLGYDKISKNIMYVDSCSNLKEKIRNTELQKEDFTNIKNESGIFIKSTETSYFLNLFYHIRCAIAHGRFMVIKDKEIIYYFENGRAIDKEKFKVSARIVIFESTLMKFIEIITKKKGICSKHVDYNIEG